MPILAAVEAQQGPIRYPSWTLIPPKGQPQTPTRINNGHHLPRHRHPRPTISTRSILYSRHWSPHLQRSDLRVGRWATAAIHLRVLASPSTEREEPGGETDTLGSAAGALSGRAEGGCGIVQLATTGWEYRVGEGDEDQSETSNCRDLCGGGYCV